MTNRPVLLTHHNPDSGSALMSLWPDPQLSCGWKLWQMTGCTKEQFVRGWDRWNLVDNIVYIDPTEERLREVWNSLADRRVIMVGRTAANQFIRLGHAYIDLIYPNRGGDGGPKEWRVIPHPIDEADEYKDVSLRFQVRLLLSDFFYNYSGFTKEDTYDSQTRRMADLAAVSPVHKEQTVGNT